MINIFLNLRRVSLNLSTKCILPNAEVAFAHVMEFVNGSKAAENVLKDCSPEMKMNIMSVIHL